MFYKIKKYIYPFCFSILNRLSLSAATSGLKDHEYLCNYKIQYYSQWESRELNKSIETHTIQASEDVRWKDSGATTKEEYELWSINICAIACFKMIAENFTSDEVKTVTLAKEAARYGAYRINNGIITGVFWKLFQRFIFEKYHVGSYTKKCLTIKELVRLLKNNQIVFLSVSPFIHRNENGAKLIKRSGHIIIVHGFKIKNGIVEGFFIKDPGAWVENGSQERFISLKKLLFNYSGRAFIIKNE